VGKTEVAVRLASRVPLEVVSADSRQVYRGMDIGTGKPSAAQRQAVPHHLLDIVDPPERYHVARFRFEALRAVEEIRSRGRLPAVVGGTGLYVRALVKGLAPAPPADPVLRRELLAFASAHGTPALHRRLAERDPRAAGRLHPNDCVRVVRALELALGSGGAGGDRPPAASARWGTAISPFRLVMAGLRQPRDLLLRRITERVHAMVAHGMMDEVKALLAAGYDARTPAMGGIGYRHFSGVLAGRLDESEAIRLTIRDTARYAKRQMTWFARDPEIRWIDVVGADGLETATDRILRRLQTEGVVA
jgi:tRNA dimethylallyltransferase